jgi:hypothetical protein
LASEKNDVILRKKRTALLAFSSRSRQLRQSYQDRKHLQEFGAEAAWPGEKLGL